MATTTMNYANAATITLTLTSLGSSATAGRESTAIDNGTNKYIDALVTGKVRVGTTPTTNTQILIHVVAAVDETPTWPDSFTGADSARSITTAGVSRGYLKLAAVLDVDSNTTARDYPFSFTVAQLFGGIMPRHWLIWVVHNTAVALNATAGEHVFKYQGIRFDVA